MEIDFKDDNFSSCVFDIDGRELKIEKQDTGGELGDGDGNFMLTFNHDGEVIFFWSGDIEKLFKVVKLVKELNDSNK